MIKFIESFIESFANHIDIISSISVLCITVGFIVFHRFSLTKKKIFDIIALGFLGGSLPVGVLFILTGLDPDLTDKLREFPKNLIIIGVVYLYLAILEIIEKFKK